MESKLRMEGYGLRIGTQDLGISIVPHLHLIHIYLVILCCESRYFEDIAKL